MTTEDRSNQVALASGNGIHIGMSCLATTHAWDPAQRQAEAIRLAACWNACKGMSTESLERLGTIDRARVELDVIRVQAIAQRDELLAAMKSIKSNLMHQRRFGTDALGNWTRAATQAEGDIEEAIAKATGQEGGAA